MDQDRSLISGIPIADGFEEPPLLGDSNVAKTDFQDAIDRALGLRIRAKKEDNPERRQALLDLAQKWEVWAEYCRDRGASGLTIDVSKAPSENID
jgi:hypothetical protein